MALSREEYDRVQECKNAKEIWDTLKVHHEGTSHVKETRIDIGVRKFELFEMKETETIDEMYGRFTIIMNELRSLEKDFTIHERVRKILRCLPRSWRHIVTAITEAKDLKKLRLEDLIGSLKAHEVLLQEDKSSNKSKMIALKTNQESLNQELEMNFDNQQQELDEEDHQDQIILLTRKLQRMIQRRDQNKRNFPARKENAKTELDKSQECLITVKKKPWYLDSGCSRHMTGDKQSFLSFTKKEGGLVTFGNNEKSRIKGIGVIDNLGKFDSKSDKAIFLGYSATSKAYRVYNLRTKVLEESMHIKFDEFEELEAQERIFEEDEEASQINPDIEKIQQQSLNEEVSLSPPKSWRIVDHHPQEQIIGETTDGVRTRRSFQTNDFAMISQIEPKSIKEAIIDESWVEAMKEELYQFEKKSSLDSCT
ncbi:uncharacterized protein [Medicago truncatula]|uniref:uncharacterized protein n=1 Tax=Medicago truncatula TaxID=3880 RepID=UPI00196786B8|nr:uncharacterized protein LOC120580158 [Medicago truncatula]